jgi:hypothetical protein
LITRKMRVRYLASDWLLKLPRALNSGNHADLITKT